MTNISQIMKQAKEMQEKMAEVQKKIEETEVEGNSGGGVVSVIMDGKHNLKKIKIDPNLIDKNEIEVLEDLIVAAVNDATKKDCRKYEQPAWLTFWWNEFTTGNETSILNKCPL